MRYNKFLFVLGWPVVLKEKRARAENRKIAGFVLGVAAKPLRVCVCVFLEIVGPLPNLFSLPGNYLVEK